MKMTVVYVVVFVVVLSSIFVLTSCGEKPRSLDNITVNYDSHPEFVLKSSKGISDDKIKKDLALIEVFNKAMKDYPYLSHMIEADMLDGIGDSGYVYDGKDMFFKKLQEFTDENYKKAKSMFPDITEDEFIYNAAIGYGVANEEEFVFEIPEEPLSERVIDSKMVKSSFDEMMMGGFWVSFFIDFYDVNVDLKEFYAGNTNTQHNLYAVTGIREYTKTVIVLRETLITMYNNGVKYKNLRKENYIKVGSPELPNHLLKEHMLQELFDIGLSKNSNQLNPFQEIGTGTMYLSKLLIDECVKKKDIEIKLGHISKACNYYIHQFFKEDFSKGVMDSYLLASIVVNVLNQNSSNSVISPGEIMDWNPSE